MITSCCILALQFFLQNGVKFVYDESNMKLSSNTMDQWILSVAQSLVLFVHKEMEGEKTLLGVFFSDLFLQQNASLHALPSFSGNIYPSFFLFLFFPIFSLSFKGRTI